MTSFILILVTSKVLSAGIYSQYHVVNYVVFGCPSPPLTIHPRHQILMIFEETNSFATQKRDVITVT